VSERALVIGGGIGGLTAARALGRAGFEVKVYERAAALEQIQVGGAIHVWHNGMRGLQLLGLGEQVAALGGREAVVQTAEMRNSRGRLLTSWSPAETERALGAPTVGVRRPELHRVLAGGIEPGVLELGRELRGVERRGERVVAVFADGSEEQGDLLIGADGMHSAVRAQLLGASEPQFQYASWQAVCGYGGEDAPVGLFRIVWGSGARFLFYHLGHGLLYWEGIHATAPGGSDPPGGRKQAVLERFAGWHAPVGQIVEATEEAEIVRADIYDRPPTKSWGEGRVTLLGDAAHPMTNAAGQGANQAIEDAVVLGRRLATREGDGDLVSALRVYERERAPRTAAITRLALNLTALSRWSGPVKCAVRDRIVSAMMLVGKRVQRKDMEYEF
jgi:2-polyprenyl-6-methoxyphenol hydroxylase-like FAD-dependent oxidoreductase